MLWGVVGLACVGCMVSLSSGACLACLSREDVDADDGMRARKNINKHDIFHIYLFEADLMRWVPVYVDCTFDLVTWLEIQVVRII